MIQSYWNDVHQLRQLQREPHSLIPVVFHVTVGMNICQLERGRRLDAVLSWVGRELGDGHYIEL